MDCSRQNTTGDLATVLLTVGRMRCEERAIDAHWSTIHLFSIGRLAWARRICTANSVSNDPTSIHCTHKIILVTTASQRIHWNWPVYDATHSLFLIFRFISCTINWTWRCVSASLILRFRIRVLHTNYQGRSANWIRLVIHHDRCFWKAPEEGWDASEHLGLERWYRSFLQSGPNSPSQTSKPGIYRSKLFQSTAEIEVHWHHFACVYLLHRHARLVLGSNSLQSLQIHLRLCNRFADLGPAFLDSQFNSDWQRLSWAPTNDPFAPALDPFFDDW